MLVGEQHLRGEAETVADRPAGRVKVVVSQGKQVHRVQRTVIPIDMEDAGL